MPARDAAEIELLQFLYSPYNEKVRWTLDLKGVPHRRRSLLPGPHALATMRLTRQRQTPALRVDGAAIAGSHRIVEYLDARYPEPPLLPRDAGARAQALAIARRFDEEFCPRIRRGVIGTMLESHEYVARVFGRDHSPLARALYARALPVTRILIARGNGIAGRDTIDDGFAAADEALAFVAATAGPSGYLVGDRFSIADLTAASHLAATVDPPHPDAARPEPAPPAVAAWLARWRAHAGSRWVLEMYARHRGPPSSSG